MNLNQFEDSIKSLFPEALLSEFHDDYGFTSSVNNNIRTIGYCTNLSLESIELAASQNIDLLLTHHDAWDFIFGLREACMEKLKEYNMSHFYIHGPLDYVEFGTCTSLMHELGIDKTVKLSTYDEGDVPGIGELSVPQSFEAFTDKMADVLNEKVRTWKHHERSVERIGMLTGAGHASTIIKKAVDAGCDTYITGEATLYSIQYAQFAGINLIAGSHTFTEVFGVETLAKKLQELNEGIEIIRIEESHFEAQD